MNTRLLSLLLLVALPLAAQVPDGPGAAPAPAAAPAPVLPFFCCLRIARLFGSPLFGL